MSIGVSPAIAFFLGLVACGRVGFDPLSASVVDGGLDADGSVLGPFGPAVTIAELNTGASEDDPTLTADRLEIVFASNRPMGMGAEDLWTPTRASVTDPWSGLRPIAEINSAAGDSAPRIARDGLTLYFDSSRGGSAGGLDV